MAGTLRTCECGGCGKVPDWRGAILRDGEAFSSIRGTRPRRCRATVRGCGVVVRRWAAVGCGWCGRADGCRRWVNEYRWRFDLPERMQGGCCPLPIPRFVLNSMAMPARAAPLLAPLLVGNQYCWLLSYRPPKTEGKMAKVVPIERLFRKVRAMISYAKSESR